MTLAFSVITTPPTKSTDAVLAHLIFPWEGKGSPVSFPSSLRQQLGDLSTRWIVFKIVGKEGLGNFVAWYFPLHAPLIFNQLSSVNSPMPPEKSVANYTDDIYTWLSPQSCKYKQNRYLSQLLLFTSLGVNALIMHQICKTLIWDISSITARDHGQKLHKRPWKT